jgi:HNH endonuclease
VKYASMFERLVANSVKPDKQNENGCWQWIGPTDGKRWPYGQVSKRVNGKHKTIKAHREMENKFRKVPLAEDETIDHLCMNPLCVNPDHFSVVTRVENSRLSQQRNPR